MSQSIVSAINEILSTDQLDQLNKTSARSMIQVVYYDTLYRMGGIATTEQITSECWRRIEPLNKYLKSPLYSQNQIAGGRTNLGYQQEFIHSIRHGVTAFINLARDNSRIIEYIESRNNFGSDCIEDMMAILDLVTDPLPCKTTAREEARRLRAKVLKPQEVDEPQPDLLRRVIARISDLIDRMSVAVTGM